MLLKTEAGELGLLLLFYFIPSYKTGVNRSNVSKHRIYLSKYLDPNN